MSKGTLTQLFFDGLDRFIPKRRTAFKAKRGGLWQPTTHQEAEARVRAISLGLKELGVQPGDKVALLSETRLEWALVDFACLCAHATDVPIYPTLLTKQVEYILKDSGATTVFCSTPEQVAKVAQIRDHLPIKYVITFDGPAGSGVTTLEELEKRGKAAEAKYPNWRADALKVSPDSLATLIYTSGTTGDPKGVMLTHDNLYSNVQACVHILPISERDECLAMLPLSHVYERMVDYVMWTAGVVISYAESFEKVAQNLRETKPTIVLSVPRLYEKVYAKVLEGASKSPLKHAIFNWSKKAGDRWATHLLSGVKIPLGISIAHAIADRLVFKKVRAATGGRLEHFISGSAPLSEDVALFFFACRLP
ncbi:MAG TPA: AMP-binding protein, partial [Gemmatimonadales bacterium]|nr:AMP-binding protein [Gemmatimonadales bacterium]